MITYLGGLLVIAGSIGIFGTGSAIWYELFVRGE